jgi:hypothetical protein
LEFSVLLAKAYFFVINDSTGNFSGCLPDFSRFQQTPKAHKINNFRVFYPHCISKKFKENQFTWWVIRESELGSHAPYFESEKNSG